MQFLALITPLASGGEPSHPIATPPVYPSQGLPVYPSHPIAPGAPPGIWGGPPLYPDQGLPGQPPVRPSHPIVVPPGSLGPGTPTHPIVIPPAPIYPSHPIVIPPDTIEPGVPTQPIYIPPVPSHPIAGQPPYPSQGPGFPSNPIVIPPAPPVEDSDLALVLVMTGSGEPVWFVIDGSEHVKPPVPTEPTPK